MSSHVRHHSILVTRSPDPQIVALQVELASLKELLAEKDRSAERERQDQKATRDKAEEVVTARLDSLNAMKEQRGEDRATFATRERVDTNTEELNKVRAHLHDIANQVQDLKGKPPQFTAEEENDFRRLRSLALKFSMDDGFMPFEMDELHDMVKERQGKEKVKERRFGTLEAAGFSALGTIVAFEVLPNILHAIFGR